jgi:hypothetical protein
MSRFPDLPAKMRRLPVDRRGFPVPWFVKWLDGEPVFPAMDGDRMVRAIRQGRCWVCGGELGRLSAFVIGPMCAINLTSAEPPSHLECARFSARNCPFLANPRMRRVPSEKYGGAGPNGAAGVMLDRNPGVTLVWIVKGRGRPYTVRADGPVGAGTLFDIGKPHAIEWYCEGRPATRAEVVDSIESGLPHLQAMVDIDPDPAGAQAEMDQRTAAAMELLPA